MRMTFFIGSVSKGGAERVICELASYFASLGNETEILTVTQTESSYFIHKNVKLVSLDDSVKRFKFAEIIRKTICLRRYLKKNNTNIYVVFLPKTIIMILLFRRLIKGKVIISERNIPSGYSLYMQRILYYLSERSDGIVFQTKEARRYYREGMRVARPSVIIPNAISKEFCSKYTGVRKKKIVAVGRLDKQKNHALLFRAFSRLSEKFSEYILEVYGEGPLRDELERLAMELNIEDKIFMPGNTGQIRQNIEDASLFVMTSDYEGMPNALIEAMALGLPCIATRFDGGSAQLLIKDGINGFLIDKGNIKQLAEKIEYVLSHIDIQQNIGAQAAKIVSILHPDKIYGRWNQFIHEIVNDT